MNIVIKITPSLQAQIFRLGNDVVGGFRAGMTNLVEVIEGEAVKRAPVKTSNLINSGTTHVSADGNEGEIKFLAPYAGFVHFGTGLYGPHKTRIVPLNKKAMRWPGASHPVRSTKGMRPRPYLYDAAKAVNAQAEYERGMNNYLKMKGW
jgi:hypothetical protein